MYLQNMHFLPNMEKHVFITKYVKMEDKFGSFSIRIM